MALIIFVLFSTSSFIASALILSFEYMTTPFDDYFAKEVMFKANKTNI